MPWVPSWTSLRPVYSSYASKVPIDVHGVLKYTFNNIDPPAKMNNRAASNGMFTINIKIKPRLPAPASHTNRAVNTIARPADTDNRKAKKRDIDDRKEQPEAHDREVKLYRTKSKRRRDYSRRHLLILRLWSYR